MTEELVVERADPRSDEARVLLAALDRELAERYPGLTAAELRVPEEDVARGAFVVARLGGEAVGCGVLRLRPEGELERMFVVPEARGRGVGRALVAALEREARALGSARLVVETGDRQPEAVALYRAAGYEPIPAFGEYAGNPWSRCFGRRL